jgi:hypothetical protein
MLPFEQRHIYNIIHHKFYFKGITDVQLPSCVYKNDYGFETDEDQDKYFNSLENIKRLYLKSKHHLII